MNTQVVSQRIRNRTVELLEWLIECENEPPRFGMNELINSWADWVPVSVAKGHFTAQGFTPLQSDLVQTVSAAIDAFCQATPQNIGDDAAVIALPQWGIVVAAARQALIAMNVKEQKSNG
ncbi:hypothetical protein [Pseudomonas versuta]|uniref:hypothetical protein n=1 Tax=Pseudomonas versuta TaxID=1788301 RepID=UPI0037CAB77A